MLHPSVRKLSDRFVVAGTMSADQLRSAIETHAIASVVQLAAWPEPMLSDLSSASSLPSSFEAVPVRPMTGEVCTCGLGSAAARTSDATGP